MQEERRIPRGPIYQSHYTREPAPLPVRPRRRRKHWRPNWEILWIGLAVIASVWLVNSVEPGVRWGEIMDYLNVHDRERYSQLCTLGLLLVGASLVWRICRGGGEEE